MDVQNTLERLNPTSLEIEQYLHLIGVNDSCSFIARINQVKRTMDIDRFGLRSDLKKYAEKVGVPLEFILLMSKGNQDYCTDYGKSCHKLISSIIISNYSQFANTGCQPTIEFGSSAILEFRGIPFESRMLSAKGKNISDAAVLVPALMTIVIVSTIGFCVWIVPLF